LNEIDVSLLGFGGDIGISDARLLTTPRSTTTVSQSDRSATSRDLNVASRGITGV